MAGRTVKKDGNSWYYILTHGRKDDGETPAIQEAWF